MGNGGLMPPARLSKEDVNYRQHEKCSTCDHFFPSGVCDIVAGTISPLNVCNRWEIKSQNTEGRDRAFYVAEFEKTNASPA